MATPKKKTGSVNIQDYRIDNEKEFINHLSYRADGSSYKVGMPSTVWYTKRMVENPTSFYHSRQRRRSRGHG